MPERSRHYLFVDDYRAFAENLGEILQDAGAAVSIASDGLEALVLLRQRHFDALVTDMRMPAMSGASLVHEAHRLDPGLPAIVVTAHSSDAELADAWREGLLAVLPKPVPLKRLLSLLAGASHTVAPSL